MVGSFVIIRALIFRPPPFHSRVVFRMALLSYLTLLDIISNIEVCQSLLKSDE